MENTRNMEDFISYTEKMINYVMRYIHNAFLAKISEFHNH